MSSEDIRTLNGSTESKLFTKDLVLKKKVGQAMKGWKLERIDGSEDDMPKAGENAKQLLLEMINGDGTTSAHNFVFSRRSASQKCTTCWPLHIHP